MKSSFSATSKYLVLLFLVQLIYGAGFTIAKEVMPAHVQPFGLIVLRVAGASILFWILHQTTIREPIRSKKDYGLLFLCGMCGAGINMLLFFKGLALTSPINGALIMVTTPILVSLLSYFFLKEHISKTNGLGIGLGCFGAVLLIYSSSEMQNQSHITHSMSWLGDLLIFLNASIYAVYMVLVKPLSQKYNPITISKWVFLFGNIVVLPIGWSEVVAVDWQGLKGIVWLEIAFVVVGLTFITYWLTAIALKHLKSSVVSSFIYLQPFVGTLVAVSSGKYGISIAQVLSGALILLGIFLGTRKR